jgi:phosphate:Na+ symporter
LISLIVGIAVTAVIQSCSASVGILQALAITGVIGYDVAIPMVIGMCIGACAPVLISAIGAKTSGKRTAFVYLYFNLIGAVILMSGFYIVDAFVNFGIMDQMATSMGIAIVNTVFKIAATILLAPFAPLMEKLAVLTIKDKKNAGDEEIQQIALEERFLDYPPLALEQSGRAVDMMTIAAFKSLKESTELLSVFSQEKYDRVMDREDIVDRYEDILGSYLVRVNARQLSEKESRTTARYLSCLTNLERISDHAVNLADLGKEISEKGIHFSPQAQNELKVCIAAVSEILDLTQKAMENTDIDLSKMVEPLEQTIDILVKKSKNHHIQRIQSGNCTLELGFVFNDCLHNLERVADHCSNLAIAVLESTISSVHGHDYLRTIKESGDNQYQILLAGYTAKYQLD